MPPFLVEPVLVLRDIPGGILNARYVALLGFPDAFHSGAIDEGYTKSIPTLFTTEGFNKLSEKSCSLRNPPGFPTAVQS
ncbi:hypothetical protein DPMN_045155 [Dreissena polymorpha]|uniref:Uncharacterized protein n=1 Tax=Dreissena polymorpha TaxID=45954 RepID=A0A9D4HX36_DREPO|nr:hypothetical protein DPMN_045155 [Dreissena polymorpha]